MEEIGFGIIGCGGISDVHAQAIQSIPGVRLIGFHNRTRPRAERQAERYGVSWDLDLDRSGGLPFGQREKAGGIAAGLTGMNS